jgi:hypothetical protein
VHIMSWDSQVYGLGSTTIASFKEIHRLLGILNKALADVETCSHLDSNLLLSITIVGTTFEKTIWSLFLKYQDLKKLQRHQYKPYGEKWRTPPMLRKQLRYAGWCPQEIASLISDFSTPGLLYASGLLRLRLNDRHSSCTEDECKGNNIEELDYKTRHVEDDCTCHVSHEGLSYNRICKIIADGRVPLVECHAKPNGKISYTISSTAANEKTPYIAISHVWSHGLGNNKANSLPDCQLRRLHSLVFEFFDNQGFSRFWIDTICIPVQAAERHLRKAAILSMAEIYGRADAVLVLDEELQQVPFPAQAQEFLLRLFASDWSRRLWTLQEAVLNKNIFVQFQDIPVPVSELFRGGLIIVPKSSNIQVPVSQILPRGRMMLTELWDTPDPSLLEVSAMFTPVEI